MEQYIGCDAPKNFSVFAWINEKGEYGLTIRVGISPRRASQTRDRAAEGDGIDRRAGVRSQAPRSRFDASQPRPLAGRRERVSRRRGAARHRAITRRKTLETNRAASRSTCPSRPRAERTSARGTTKSTAGRAAQPRAAGRSRKVGSAHPSRRRFPRRERSTSPRGGVQSRDHTE